jgi:hypothetical protein
MMQKLDEHAKPMFILISLLLQQSAAILMPRRLQHIKECEEMVLMHLLMLGCLQECSALAAALASCVSLDNSADSLPAAVAQLQCRLGLSDLQLSLLPPSVLKKLGAGTTGMLGLPDLCHLSCPGLTHLRLDLSSMRAAAEAALLQQQQQQQEQQQVDLLAADAQQVVMGLVCSLALGNGVIKVLKLEGVDAAAAEVIGKAVCRGCSRCSTSNADSDLQLLGSQVQRSSSGCQLSLLVLNGMSVPVRALLGVSEAVECSSPGKQVLLHELDLVNSSITSSSNAAAGTAAAPKHSTAKAGQQQQQHGMLLGEEHVVFLSVLLPFCTGLKQLRLPLLAPNASAKAAERLVDAVLQLKLLEEFNGLPVQHQQQQQQRQQQPDSCEQPVGASSSAGKDPYASNIHSGSECKQGNGSSSSSRFAELMNRVPSWQHVELATMGVTGSANNSTGNTHSSQQCLDVSGRQLGAPGAALLVQCLAAGAAAGAVGICLSGERLPCYLGCCCLGDVKTSA